MGETLSSFSLYGVKALRLLEIIALPAVVWVSNSDNASVVPSLKTGAMTSTPFFELLLAFTP